MMRVRILCGAYTPSSPFIDGGCACDWIEILDFPQDITCPGCGQEFVECVQTMLEMKPVFVLGCVHRAFTFSRREREPYFSPVATPEEAGEFSE